MFCHLDALTKQTPHDEESAGSDPWTAQKIPSLARLHCVIFFVRNVLDVSVSYTNNPWLLLYHAFSLKLFLVAMETPVLAVHLSVTPTSVPNYIFFSSKIKPFTASYFKAIISCLSLLFLFFFSFSLHVFVLLRLLQESLSHADTHSPGFMSLFLSHSGSNP